VSALEKNNGVADRFGTLVKLVYGIIALAVILAAPAARAQPISDADRARLEAQKAALFQQMLRNPANRDVTFSYADVSARLGDYEAAVSALERMLLFNPNPMTPLATFGGSSHRAASRRRSSAIL
jgi:hypothetical protein